MTNVRTTAWILGLAGLIPFVVPGVAVWFAPEGSEAADTAISILILYGAVILSFLGGARWGAGLHAKGAATPITLILAVLPSLWACGAVLSIMASDGLWPAAVLLLIGLALQWIWDARAIAAGAFPRWYAALRLTLTLGACLSLLSGALYAVRFG